MPSEEGEEQVQEEEKPDDQAEMSEVQADDVVPGDEGETPRET